MGFECRLFGNGYGKSKSVEGKNARAVLVARKSNIRKPHEGRRRGWFWGIETLVASRRGSGVVRGVSGLSLRAVKAFNLGVLALAKLVRREALDKAHRASTARTFPQNLGCRRRWRREFGTHK